MNKTQIETEIAVLIKKHQVELPRQELESIFGLEAHYRMSLYSYSPSTPFFIGKMIEDEIISKLCKFYNKQRVKSKRINDILHLLNDMKEEYFIKYKK